MNKIEALEKKLNIATSLIEELDIEDCDIVPPNMAQSITVVEPIDGTINLPSTDVKQQEEVFSIDALKTDFVLIRQNLLKLITTGQRILDSASLIDVADMKASQLTALSSLLETVGSHCRTMVDIYKQISEIEKIRMCTTGKSPEGVNQINTGNTINNTQIIYTGDTSNLLDYIKQAQENK